MAECEAGRKDHGIWEPCTAAWRRPEEGKPNTVTPTTMTTTAPSKVWVQKKKVALENYEMSSIGVLAKAGWSSGRNAGEDTRGDIWSNWWEDTHSPLFLSPRGRTSLTNAPGLSCPLSGARGSRKWACSARPHVISSLVWPVCLM